MIASVAVLYSAVGLYGSSHWDYLNMVDLYAKPQHGYRVRGTLALPIPAQVGPELTVHYTVYLDTTVQPQ